MSKDKNRSDKEKDSKNKVEIIEIVFVMRRSQTRKKL